MILKKEQIYICSFLFIFSPIYVIMYNYIEKNGDDVKIW